MIKGYHSFLKFTVWALGLLLVLSCKEELKFFGEPYEDGLPPLGIKMYPAEAPVPATGEPGTEVFVRAGGLLEYADQLVFRFNGEDAEIQEVTDEGLRVSVPTFASTGVTSISVGDIIVFGPSFEVEGRVRLDPTFAAAAGANGGVYDVLETNDGRRLVVGAFTDYNNSGIVNPINRIAMTFPDGGYDNEFRIGDGANGHLSSALQLGDKYFIAGAFSGYGQQTGNISNLTMLNSNGMIDTMGIETWRRPDQEDTTQYFARFNGGFHGGSVAKIYEQNNKILATGNYRYYVSRQYDKPNRLETRDSIIIDSIEMRQIARLNLDGTLDKTYRYDGGTGSSPTGANGSIATIYHDRGAQAGKLVVFGHFSQFDGQPYGRMVRLNPDGTIDNSFNPGGEGFDFHVHNVTYNVTTRQYLVCGYFRTYNGAPVGSVVLLNEDGSLDGSFTAQPFLNGLPYYAKQLQNGLVFVSGTFQQYGDVVRNGMMFLDGQGNLAEGYNNLGTFVGTVNEVYETETAEGRPALLIAGLFFQFNGEPANNILRVTLGE